MSSEFEYKGVVYPIREKSGEVTGTPLYQVADQRYVETWQSSPGEAVDVYLRVKKAVDSGYYSTSNKKRN